MKLVVKSTLNDCKPPNNYHFTMTKEEYLSLYEKYLSGACSAEEKALLDNYQDNMILPDDQWDPDLGNEKAIYADVYSKFKRSQSKTKIGRAPVFFWLKIAAVLFVCVSSALLIWKLQYHSKNNPPLIARHNQSIIRPGGNKAYLTMAGGSVVVLNDIKNGEIATQAGVQVSKTKEGLLVYKDNRTAGNKKPDINEPDQNTVTTPRGGQYQIVLSDGTKVWLNAATALKYPTSFSGKDRKVELSGEAYFEVAKNATKPFKVVVNGLEVQVLGTHFNVMAYDNEKVVKTTLLEGKVRLFKNGHEAVLKPGEQGVLNNQSSLFEVKDVNVDDETAWKNGFFAFNNESIETIMRQISRWYDVDVAFSEKMMRRNFGGSVSRYENVGTVLKALELTGSVHFNVEGRRITVMP